MLLPPHLFNVLLNPPPTMILGPARTAVIAPAWVCNVTAPLNREARGIAPETFS